MSYLGRGSNLTRKAQDKVSFLATAGQTVRTGLSYVPTHVDVTVNGITLTEITDYTATNGNSITFTVALALNDEVTIVSSKTFDVANHYTISAANALLAAKATNTAVALKAPIASPSFTGTVSIDSPNQASGGNALKIRQGNATSFGIDMGLSQVTGHLNISKVNSGTATHMMTLARDTGNVGVGTASPSSKLTSESAAATNIVAKSTNGNGGYMNYQGLASNGTQTFAVNHNGTIFTTSGLAVGGVGANNTLDDYEEGTWTPILRGNTPAPSGQSYARQNGRYTKVGRLVTLEFDVELSAKGTVGGTYLIISGVPFSADMAHASGVSGVYFSSMGISCTSVVATCQRNDQIFLWVTTAAQTTLTRTNPATSYLTNTTRFVGSVTFSTS